MPQFSNTLVNLYRALMSPTKYYLNAQILFIAAKNSSIGKQSKASLKC